MSIAKKIANRHWEEDGTWTTRSVSRHGIGRERRRVKNLRNRMAKRAEERIARKDQES